MVHCGLANATACPQAASLPADFCCLASESCVATAANTTLLCCPGASAAACDQIAPLTCDLAVQNVTALPATDLMTTELAGALPACGDACCPWGYKCDEDTAACVLEADQDKIPAGASPSSSRVVAVSSGDASTAASSSTPVSSAPHVSISVVVVVYTNFPTSATGSRTNPTATNQANASDPTSHGGLQGGSIAGIAVGGVVGILLLSLAVYLYLARRLYPARREKKRQSEEWEKSKAHAVRDDGRQPLASHPVDLDCGSPGHAAELSARENEVHEVS